MYIQQNRNPGTRSTMYSLTVATNGSSALIGAVNYALNISKTRRRAVNVSKVPATVSGGVFRLLIGVHLSQDRVQTHLATLVVP